MKYNNAAQSVQFVATDWTTRVRSQQRQRIFPLASVSRVALRPTQPPIHCVLGIPSRGKGRQRRDHSPLSSAEVKNE
jgi:hypothetical protein